MTARSKYSRVIVAQIGARRAYSVPRAFEQAGCLERFYTDSCAGSGLLGTVARLLPSTLANGAVGRLLGREVAGVPSNKIRTDTSLVVKKLVRGSGTPGRAGLLDVWTMNNRMFCESVVRSGISGASAVYVFNAAGLEIMQEARRLGIPCILDQSSAPVEVEQELLQEEREAWPGYDLVDPAEEDAVKRFAEREQRERALADLVLCGSEYVEDCVSPRLTDTQYAAIVPYGTCTAVGGGERKPGPTLRVLFVGTVQLLKGIQYLAAAADLLNERTDIEFRAVGPIRMPEKAVQDVGGKMRLVGPVSREKVSDHYEWADVLVHPSLSEGSSNVCYEAMAAGLPVIATPNAGSAVRDEIEGYIVPIRDADAMAERISRLADDRELLVRMSSSSASRSSEFTMDAYVARLRAALGLETMEEKNDG